MFMEERQQEIAEHIKTYGKILISEIVEKNGVSEESARRDLRILERNGMCKRTRGGAIELRQVNVRPPKKREYETMQIYDNYREISRKASEMIKESDSIYLTGGSFGHIMLEFLPKDIPYTLVVNSVDIANSLRNFDNIDVYVAGGKMRQSGSIVDSLAVEFVRNLHFDRCFLTGSGLTADFGLSNGTDETAAFQRTIMKNSRESILLMPGNKIGTDSFIKVCEAAAFDKIITDWDCLDEYVNQLQEQDIEVIVVENRK